jgi:hypothetical protein
MRSLHKENFVRLSIPAFISNYTWWISQNIRANRFTLQFLRQISLWTVLVINNKSLAKMVSNPKFFNLQIKPNFHQAQI